MGVTSSKLRKGKHATGPVDKGKQSGKADDEGKQQEVDEQLEAEADNKGKKPAAENDVVDKIDMEVQHKRAVDKGKQSGKADDEAKQSGKADEEGNQQEVDAQQKAEADDKGKKPAAENDADDKIDREGKKRTISPWGLSITWGNDGRYWRQVTEKTKDKPAELLKVCWLQVTGSADVEHGKSYKIKFKITLKDGASGWNGLPLFLMAKIGDKGKYTWKKIKPLDETKTDEAFEIPEEDFSVEIPKDGEEKLFFGFYEIWSNKWKTGLLIHNATIEETIRSAN